jgi:thiol:disulfide interchange protein
MKKTKFILLTVCVIITMSFIGCNKNKKQTQSPQKSNTQLNWKPFSTKVFDKKIEKDYILVYITSPYCSACRYLEATTFSSNRVVPVVNNLFYPVKLDLSAPENAFIVKSVLSKEARIPQMIFYVRKNTKENTQSIVSDFDYLGVDKNKFYKAAATVGVANKFTFVKFITQIQSLKKSHSFFELPVIKSGTIDFNNSENGFNYIFILK